MDIVELEIMLRDAKEQVALAANALSFAHKGGEWEAYEAAYTNVTGLQRAIAKTKGEPHAVPFDFPIAWDIGAPSPHLLQNDFYAFLVFYTRHNTVLPENIKIRVLSENSLNEAQQEYIAVVQFNDCVTTRMGDPNDEVFHGHPLAERGGEPYTAQIVEQSLWIPEFERINQVHTNYNADTWKRLKHYIFWFHDTTFECIASSWELSLYSATLEPVLADICRRLVR